MAGPGAVPPAGLDAWLVTDTRSELIAAIRRLAGARGVVPYAGPFHARGLCLTNREVVHTSRPTFGYSIELAGREECQGRRPAGGWHILRLHGSISPDAPQRLAAG
jgi:hypothetical protein